MKLFGTAAEQDLAQAVGILNDAAISQAAQIKQLEKQVSVLEKKLARVRL